MHDGVIRYIVRGDTPDTWTDRGLVNIGSGRTILGLASFFSDRDGCGHLIVACDDGDILDIRVSPDAASVEPSFLDVRANIPNPVAVTGYYASPSDGGDDYHHLYVASADGNIHEIWFPGVATAGQGGVCIRAQFSDLKAIAAYFGLDDFLHHLVVATTDSKIREFLWRS